jgi:thermostable 8-oxoguanine DNA glycosylase
MINPNAITNFARTDYELQEFILFCIVVAGKNSQVQAKKLAEFLSVTEESPFDFIRQCVVDGTLRGHLERVKMGQYGRLTKVFDDIATSIIDLRNVSVAILQNIVGLKTARFFLMHSRAGFRCATLDTHILAWLNTQGVVAPKATPSNLNKYLTLEAKYLEICDARGLDPAALDLEIWKSRQVSVAAKEISAVA